MEARYLKARHVSFTLLKPHLAISHNDTRHGLGRSAGPSRASTSGHAADPPSADPLGGADMSLLQRAGVLQNTPYDA